MTDYQDRLKKLLPAGYVQLFGNHNETDYDRGNDMNDTTMIVPQPHAPCPDCVENARHQSEDVGMVWCGHVSYGGIYLAEQGQWQIVGPYGDESEFKRAVFNNLARKAQARGLIQ